jgi:hypothetical protein
MAVFSVVFERQGEGSEEVNGLAHVCPHPLADNQDWVHATTWPEWQSLFDQHAFRASSHDPRLVGTVNAPVGQGWG